MGQRAFLILLVLCWASCAHAVSLQETVDVPHEAVPPGHSISVVVDHPLGHIPLVTILDHRDSTTVLYSFDFVGEAGVIVRCFNYGWYPQSGVVVVGFWE